jgi:hypothetical protein
MEAKDRLAQRRLIAEHSRTPVKTTVAEDASPPVQATPRQVTSPGSESAVTAPFTELSVKYGDLLEDRCEMPQTPKTPRRRSLIITEAAGIIKSASKTAPTGRNTKLKRLEGEGGESKGSKMVLTPLRASKRVQQGTIWAK